MKLIWSYLWRSIMEKKSRTFLIIFSISICCALFFGTIAISLTIEDIYVQKIRSQIGTAEIVVTQGENKECSFFENNIESDDIDYSIGCVVTEGYAKTNKNELITLYGYDLEELDQMNPIIMVEQDQCSFEGKRLILSQSYADELNVTIGDVYEITIGNIELEFEVWGISNDYGIFENNSFNAVIVPKKTLQDEFNIEEKVNLIYVKNKDGVSIEKVMDELEVVYPEEQVTQTITKKEIQSYTNRITRTFLLMLIAVLVISVFIIYTSFRIIVTERMGVLATFRSVGATKAKTTLILLVEAVTYALFSGVLGCVLGVGIDYMMSRMSTPVWLLEAKGIQLKLNVFQFVLTMLLALGITLLSAIVPILLSNKYSIRRLLFEDFNNKSEKKVAKFIIGIIFISASLILSIITPLKSAILVNAVGLILCIVGIILCIPVCMTLFVKIAMEITKNLKCGSVKIAILNLRDNKSVKNNIILIVIGISSVFIINTARQGVFGAIVNIYDSLDYSVRLTADELQSDSLEEICAIESVEDAFGLYQVSNVEVKGKDSKIKMIWGANNTNFDEFIMLDYGKQEDVLEQLEQDRNILLTYSVSELLDVGIRDEIELKFGDEFYTYHVIGLFNTMINYGNFALISEDNLAKDGDLHSYAEIDIKIQDVHDLETTLGDQTMIEYPKITSMEEEKESVLESNKQIYTILIFFSIMTILIGCIGTINNFIISFMERKKSFAVLRSVGMSNASCMRMILLEALFSAIFAGVFGNISGYVMSLIVQKLIAGIGIPISIQYTVSDFFIYLGASVAITLFCSINMCRKFKKINVVESLKFE